MSKQDILLMSMEEELERAEKITDHGSRVRNRAHLILEDAVSKIAFTEEDVRDPKATTAMLSIINAYTSNAKEDESSAFKRVGAKARLKEIKSNEQQSEAAIGLIKSIAQRDTKKDIELKEAPTEINLNLSPDIKDSIKSSELRDNPDDLSNT